MNHLKLVLLLVIAVSIGLFFVLDGQHYLSLEHIKNQQQQLELFRQQQPVLAMLLYAAIYIVVTSLSLPGAAVLTLAGGGIFGLWWSTVIVSFASTIGATLAFLSARFLLRDWVRSHFGHRLQAIEKGLQQDGVFYLFTLRLVPVFPFFLINLAMGLTPMKTRTFFWVSQVGMLAGTLVYVNAGTQLAQLETLSGIMSPTVLASFALLGGFPWFSKWLMSIIQNRKIYARWSKPRHFDYNLLVIGAGAGGLVTAYIAAAIKAKVCLIEKQQMGGDCLNSGCVPSKALLRSAKFMAQLRRAEEFGIKPVNAQCDFAAVMQRVQNMIQNVAPHDSVQRYTELGVEVIQGAAKIIDPWTVQITTEAGKHTITSRALVIAAGGKPHVPNIPGLECIDYLTSDTIWQLRELPRRLLVIGGGPIGCELAQAFARFGSQVTLLQKDARLLPREDKDASITLLEQLKREGVDVRLQHCALLFEPGNLMAEFQGQSVRIEFDQVLLAVGRAANVDGYGVQALDIQLSPQGTIVSNPYQQTNYPNIYAVGDVTGPYQFTHVAAHQAWYAAVNALFSPLKRFRTDYSVIPWATFTDPEIARVGLNEQDALAQGIAYEVTQYAIDDLDRAITDGEAHGFVKVLTVPGKDKILGVTIVGAHAGDVIAEFVLAMKYNIGLNKILGTIHIYPTFAEANKYAAGQWKRKHAPQRILSWLQRFHGWRR